MPGILHVDLVEQTPGSLLLRFWRDNRHAPLQRHVGRSSWTDCVSIRTDLPI